MPCYMLRAWPEGVVFSSVGLAARNQMLVQVLRHNFRANVAAPD